MRKFNRRLISVIILLIFLFFQYCTIFRYSKAADYTIQSVEHTTSSVGSELTSSSIAGSFRGSYNGYVIDSVKINKTTQKYRYSFSYTMTENSGNTVVAFNGNYTTDVGSQYKDKDAAKAAAEQRKNNLQKMTTEQQIAESTALTSYKNQGYKLSVNSFEIKEEEFGTYYKRYRYTVKAYVSKWKETTKTATYDSTKTTFDAAMVDWKSKNPGAQCTYKGRQTIYIYECTINYRVPTTGGGTTNPTGGTTNPTGGTTNPTGGTTNPTGGGTTNPSNGGGSTGGTTTPTVDTGVISENTVYTNDLSAGDQLKFVANSWNIKSGDGQGNSGKYLSTNDLMEIVAKGSTNNYLKVKMLSGKYKGDTVWIYYGSTGTTNFTKVKTAEITTSSDEAGDTKQTETVDNGTATTNVINFVKQVYGTTNITKDTQVVKDLLSESKTASDVVSSYLMTNVINAGANLETFINLTYQKALGRAATEDEIKKYTESSEASEDKGVLYSQVVADVLASNEFKLICEKYGVDVGSYTATTYNADTTTEKASNFVKHLYSSVLNKNMTTEQVSNIANKLVSGKITASGVMKAFFESDNIKNLKLSDEEFVKRLGKACFNQDLPSDKVTEYTNKLSSGTSRNELLKEFLGKTDFQNLCNTYGLTKGTYTPGKTTSTEALADEFVVNVHKVLFGEDSQAISAYTNGLVNGNYTAASVIQDYIDSANFKTKVTTENMTDEQYVKTVFKAVLQRDPTSAELSEYLGKLDSSNKIAILEDMFNLKEFTVLCNEYYLTPGGYTTVKAETTQTTTTTVNGATITRKTKTLSDGTVMQTVTAVEFDVSTGVKGDVNGDGSADASDASLILMYVSANQLNFVKPTDDVLAVADIEGDKKITADDASYILQFSATRGVTPKETSSESIWEEILKEETTTEETTTEEEQTTQEEQTNSENINATSNNNVTNEIVNNSVSNETVSENILNNVDE